MKRTFTLITGLIISIISFAAGNDGTLAITVAGSGTIEVIVDNRRIQERDNSVLIDNLNPGYHTVKIYRQRQSYVNNRKWPSNSGNRAELIYQATLNIRSRQFVDIMINRFGKAFVDERSVGWNDDDWSGNRNDRSPQYDPRDDRYDRNNYGTSMREEEFLRIREQLRRENFENARFNLAQQVVERNYLSSMQLRQVLQLFSLESNKLELAKLGYRNLTDKRNYTILYDVFSFMRTREELTQYVERFRD